MVLPSLCESHFYRITGLLDQKERAIVKRVRDFMEAEVAPIIEDYWARSTLTSPVRTRALPAQPGSKQRPKYQQLSTILAPLIQCRGDAAR